MPIEDQDTANTGAGATGSNAGKQVVVMADGNEIPLTDVVSGANIEKLRVSKVVVGDMGTVQIGQLPDDIQKEAVAKYGSGKRGKPVGKPVK